MSAMDDEARAALERQQAEREEIDRALVVATLEGDPRAFEQLVRHYQGRVFGLVLRMLRDQEEAADIAQDVFIRAHRALHTWRRDGRFAAWLFRIASNTCRNRIQYLKHRRARSRVAIDDAPQGSLASETTGPLGPSMQARLPGPEASFEGKRLEDAVREELANLDEDQRLLIMLRDVHGHTYEEIEVITGLPLGTVKSRLHRGRAALKQALDRYLK